MAARNSAAMASLAVKINFRRHRNGTVSMVISTGDHPDALLYAGDLSMSERQFEFFTKTLETGAIALKTVTHLDIQEVLTDESSQL